MFREFAFAALIGALVCPSAHAVSSAGIGNTDVSPRSLGMGGVGVADQAEPANAYLNPANLSGLAGTQVQAGATFILPYVKYTDTAGNETKMKTILLGVPNFAASYQINDQWTAGLAVESPFGAATQWDPASNLRYLAIKSALNLIDVAPSVAYKVAPNLSFGAALHWYDAYNLTLTNAINENNLNCALTLAAGAPSCTPTFGYNAPYADGNSDLEGHANKVGFGLGVSYQPADGHSIGVSYTSKATLGFKGALNLTNLSGASAAAFNGTSFNTTMNVDLPLPAIVNVGYKYTPDKSWKFEGDATWYGWSAFQQLAPTYTTQNTGAQSILAKSAKTYNFRDVVSVGVGTEYTGMGDGVVLRGGYAFQPHLGNSNYFGPVINDFTRHEFTFGAGVPFLGGSVDANYMLILHAARDISGSSVGSGTGENVNGHWAETGHLLSLNYTKRF